MGDVPVESSVHGSLILHRLLTGYPKDKLAVIECGDHSSLVERRIPKVGYHYLASPLRRLHRTRFSRHARGLSCLWACWRRDCARVLRAFRPEAILTVAHGPGWITAARLALREGLPLHMIVHDDPNALETVSDAMRSTVARWFASAYRQSATRLCVSKPMAESFQRRYGVEGIVLMPSRAAKDSDLPTKTTASRASVVAYGGTINNPGYASALVAMASVQAERGGFLDLYGPIEATYLKQFGLEGAHVRYRGLMRPTEFIKAVNESADILYAPMSFAAEDAQNMRVAFPSKLADYTRAGIPMLVRAPEYAAVVEWTRENGGCAELVTEESTSLLSAAMSRLDEAAHREVLARRAARAGRANFSADAAETRFFTALSQH